MMHGTVKEVSERLTELFAEECYVSILVWTTEDVIDCAECMDITGNEADRILECFADAGDHQRYGIGRDTVRYMLSKLREEEEQARKGKREKTLAKGE